MLPPSPVRRPERTAGRRRGLRHIRLRQSGAFARLPLSAGSLWLALHLDSDVRSGPLPEYTHVAFDIDPALFVDFCKRLREAGVTEWQANSSEGESIYVLDPDGHKLEVHCSDLQTRLVTDARR